MSVRLPIAQDKARARRPAPRFPGEELLAFRCTMCGNCCTQTIVPVTAADVARLAAGTGIPAERIVTFHAADDFSSGAEDLSYAELDVGRRVMCLRRRKVGDGNVCRFYGKDGCSVYEHRPLTCRQWPFDVTLDGRGHLQGLAVMDSVPCPYELDGHIDARELSRGTQVSQSADRRWAEQVARWNKRHPGGTTQAFLAFVGLR